MSDGWCTIESDPAVFTEMIAGFGVKDVIVEEVPFLDDDSLNALGAPLHGLILLFKWQKQKGQRNVKTDAGEIYFARQTVSNACATQAIINILLNKKDSLDLGEQLGQFYEFTVALDPQTRGEQIGEHQVLRTVHNSFAKSTAFSFEDKQEKSDDDVFHFVGYIYKAGAIWELDGLQEGPIHCAAAADDNWKAKLIETVQARMTELSALDTKGDGQGISFSLMALVGDPIPQLELDIAMKASAEEDCTFLQDRLEGLREKREKGRLENIRRRHNYIPCVIALLRALAEKGKLEAAIAAGKQRTAEKRAAKKARTGKS
jgi:ubiquitin carboxyl-terminal hydrolase L5